jgi:hypothetical protein
MVNPHRHMAADPLTKQLSTELEIDERTVAAELRRLRGNGKRRLRKTRAQRRIAEALAKMGGGG